MHFLDGHPLAQAGGRAVVAYRLGRIEDGVHNTLVHTGETIPLDEFLAAMVASARAEYPDAIVQIERLVDLGDGTGAWIPAEKFDPAVHRPVGAGASIAREVAADLQPGAGAS